MSNISLTNSFLERWKEYFSWVPPKGGCTGFMRYKRFNEDYPTLENLAKVLVEKYSVLILPGSHYPGDIIVKDHFRFGFGRANFPVALGVFENALKEIFQLT